MPPIPFCLLPRRRPAMSVVFAFLALLCAGVAVEGCTTGCVAAHGMPGEEDEFKDVAMDDGSWEIVLPYTELVKCTQGQVPPGPIAMNRAQALCPAGFDLLVDGELRPSDGHTTEELVWLVRCSGG